MLKVISSLYVTLNDTYQPLTSSSTTLQGTTTIEKYHIFQQWDIKA